MPPCTKATFHTKEKAEARLAELLDIYQLQPSLAKDAPKAAYQCTQCGFWHLTANLKGKANKMHQKRKRKDNSAKELRQETYEKYGPQGLSNFEKIGKKKYFGNR
jgi:hypothetical protein